jgi:molecular chaperone Hsp33
MLQHMPKAEVQASGARAARARMGFWRPDDLMDEDEGENWRRANMLLDTAESWSCGPARGAHGPAGAPVPRGRRRVSSTRSRCSSAAPVRPDRVRQSLSIYSAKDIGHMTTDDGIVTADCQFCGAHYEFDPETLGFEADPARRDDGQDGLISTGCGGVSRVPPQRRRRIST